MQPFSESVDICSNHEQCEARRAEIKMTKGFVAKEPVKGHMVSLFLIAFPSLFLHWEVLDASVASRITNGFLQIAGECC